MNLKEINTALEKMRSKADRMKKSRERDAFLKQVKKDISIFNRQNRPNLTVMNQILTEREKEFEELT